MKRVMVCGEFSQLSTGYANYSRELLKRLHASGKYDLLEFASYCPPGEQTLPWRVVSAAPLNEEERKLYDGPLAQFGSVKFEGVMLAFKAQACISWRDAWMDEHIATSPLRPYFGYAYMPTVDAIPQRDDWLGQFKSADALLSYTDWGAEVLRTQSAGSFNVLGSAPAGVDGEVFKPVPDKGAHKERLGLDPSSLIVGMTARNQRRKLFPDLAGAFVKLLASLPEKIGRKTYLYWHTAWPDVGWDMPRLLREYGLSSKVLFTYLCKGCGAYYPAFFSDAVSACRACGKVMSTFPTTQHGLTLEALSAIYNTFDVYVQYCNSEGFGLPSVEAAACAIPSMAVDYSAMGDVIRKVGGSPLKVLHLNTEAETGCLRAVPDGDDFVAKARALLVLPEPARRSLGMASRRAALAAFNWDRTASVWMRAIDSVRPKLPWDAPARLHKAVKTLPEGLSSWDFVRWGMSFLAGRPELVDSYTAARMARDLSWGGTCGNGMGGHYLNDASTLGSQERLRPFSREEAARMMAEMGEKKNYWERARVS